MPRDFNVYLDDILEAIQRIREYTDGFSEEMFIGDVKTQDAVIRNLEVIGEAVRQIPEAKRAEFPELEWRKVVGLRDILIHRYFGVDPTIVWDVVANKLSELEVVVQKMSGNSSSGKSEPPQA
jgi:uncharacterized protein with HEPN domain